MMECNGCIILNLLRSRFDATKKETVVIREVDNSVINTFVILAMTFFEVILISCQFVKTCDRLFKNWICRYFNSS